MDGFNYACNKNSESYLKVSDELTSDIHLQTTLKGRLPHLYYILHNTETLEKYLKKMEFSATGVLILLDIHRGK